MAARSRGKKKSKRGGKPQPLDLGAIFEGRELHNYGAGEAPVIVDTDGETLYDFKTGDPVQSSYPHRTFEDSGRPEHVTSSRVIRAPADDADPWVIHQRFHQDTDGTSHPAHDRFFAVNQETGVVHTVRVSFTTDKSVAHIGKKDALPARDDPIGAATELEEAGKLVFEIGGVNETHPPMSPRSVRRQVGDEGYPRKDST
ncbi:MAG: hypothetical protein AAFN27_22295 [Pseudomonadota bacterium]